MSRGPDAEIHHGVWSSNRLTTHSLLVRTIYGDCPALSSATEDFENAESRLLNVQNNGDLFRWDDGSTAEHMCTVVLAYTK